MSATKRGKLWEFANSLWIIISFIFFLNGFALIFIGIMARDKKWTILGFAYEAYVFTYIAMLPTSNAQQQTGAIYNIFVILFFVSYIALIIYSFLIRKKYLKKLDLLKDNKNGKSNMTATINEENNNNEEEENVTVQININREDAEQTPPQPAPLTRIVDKKESNDENVDLIDINSCDENTLAGLPGVGLILAKKAINIRNSKNGFVSVDEFIRELSINEYYGKKLKETVYCKAIKKDVTQKTMGRMVDF